MLSNFFYFLMLYYIKAYFLFDLDLDFDFDDDFD